MLKLLKWQSYEQASLAVHKVNYAVKTYKNVGFETVDENAEKYIMVCEPTIRRDLTDSAKQGISGLYD